MAKVIWTEIALDDLRSIHEYVSKDSVAYADKQVERIVSRVDQLIDFTKSGRIVPEFQMEDLRELIEGSYRIVYKINSDSVGIVRVHHSSRLLDQI
jgi:toxin ParE1/3/4